MFCYRVTKYNPMYRNTQGHYLKEEWTSCSEIGTSYNNQVFTKQQYIHIETAYVNAILLFMDCLNIRSLYIKKLEKHLRKHDALEYSEDMMRTYKAIQTGLVVNKKEVENVARLTLREDMWCQLETTEMYVHFGYDYYMYLGSKKTCKSAITKIMDNGLFIEPILYSPWMDDVE